MDRSGFPETAPDAGPCRRRLAASRRSPAGTGKDGGQLDRRTSAGRTGTITLCVRTYILCASLLTPHSGRPKVSRAVALWHGLLTSHCGTVSRPSHRGARKLSKSAWRVGRTGGARETYRSGFRRGQRPAPSAGVAVSAGRRAAPSEAPRRAPSASGLPRRAQSQVGRSGVRRGKQN